jgi:hypothetical protein
MPRRCLPLNRTVLAAMRPRWPDARIRLCVDPEFGALKVYSHCLPNYDAIRAAGAEILFKSVG